jgi:hypothetical protein
MFCPRCNAPVMPGSPYCANCNFNFAAAQYSAPPVTEMKHEKRYRNLLIGLAVFFVFDGIFWRVMQKLSESFGHDVHDYIKPYQWLENSAYAALPALVGFLLPKTTPWKLILIIGGSIWFAIAMFERIQREFFDDNFVFFQF